jgi:hypothetical protein
MNSNQQKNSNEQILFDSNLANSIGVQLVEILYKNTNLNYDVCAVNLVEVFSHLSQKLPELNDLSSKLIHSFRSSIQDKSNPDLSCLDRNFKCLNSLNNDIQTGEKNFYEINDRLLIYLKQNIKLIVSFSYVFIN